MIHLNCCNLTLMILINSLQHLKMLQNYSKSSCSRIHIRLSIQWKTPFQEKNFYALELTDYFSIIVISEAIGLRKPDPEIYLYTCNQLDCKPSDCIFIGDNPKADIEGAKNWYENNIFSSNSYPSSFSFRCKYSSLR